MVRIIFENTIKESKPLFKIANTVYKVGFKQNQKIIDKGQPEQYAIEKNGVYYLYADIKGIKIINVYVPNGSSLNSDKFEYKINWLNYLASFLDMQEKKGNLICLLGDFNIAPLNHDIHDPQKHEGGIMASAVERKALNNVLKGRFIDSFRVFEKNTGHWSWWDYRNNAYELNKGWRIDHIYISKALSPILKSCVIDSNPRENLQPSDHAPVMINLDVDNLTEKYFDEDDDFFEI